jgi:hypothetical protein
MTDTCDPAGTGNPRLDCFGAHHCRAASSLVLKRVDINPGGEVRPRRECGPLPRFLVASADDQLRSDCSGGLAAYGDVVMAAGGVKWVDSFTYSLRTRSCSTRTCGGEAPTASWPISARGAHG